MPRAWASSTRPCSEKTTGRAQALKRLYDNPWTNAAITFAQPLPIGLAAAAISAAILRQRRKEQHP